MTSLADIYGDEPIARFVFSETDPYVSASSFRQICETIAGPEVDDNGNPRWEAELEHRPGRYVVTVRAWSPF